MVCWRGRGKEREDVLEGERKRKRRYFGGKEEKKEMVCWRGRGKEREDVLEGERNSLFLCWLHNVPATCECISGADLLKQFYVLPH